MTLDLTQKYQMVSGKAAAGERSSEVSGKLKGTEVTLTVTRDGAKRELKGVVEGNEIRGARGAWRARRT